MTRQRIARLSVVAALFFGAATATAQRILADFSGAWNVTVEGPQGPMNSMLTLKQTGDTISGEFQSEIGNAPVSGMVKGDSIKVSFGIDMGGQQLSLQVIGALKDADNLGGTIEAAGMGGFPFVATRKK
ncbi:MAG: hypothetical protein IPP90_03465 [Gemmatimonadaceae bacterium]|nr:hypothetical protein [Gemmatimonadaceae bacterium]